MTMITKEQIIEALKRCSDPEIGIDIWTLGLIYNIETKGSIVSIRMTFTSQFCPYGDVLVEDIKREVMKIDSIKEVNVEVVFEPPWSPSEEVKMMLGVP